MAVGVCILDRDSLGEASKKWRVKRRRAAADPAQEPQQHRQPIRIQPLSPPPTNTGSSGYNDIGGCEGPTASGKRQRRRRQWRRGLVSKESLAGKFTESLPKLALLPQQVSWSLTQECRSWGAVGHRRRQLAYILERKSEVGGTFPIHSGVPTSMPRQNYDASPEIATFGDDSQDGCGDGIGENDGTGETNDDSNNNVDDSHSGDSSGGFHLAVNSSSNVVGDASANGDGIGGKLASSSWQLRRHFPPKALVPRAPPTYIFPGGPAPAKPPAAHATPAQISSTARSDVVLPAEVLSAGPGALQPAGAPMARPRTSESQPLATTSAADRTPKRVGVRRRPHTVSTGLQDLGLAWARAENTSFETRQGVSSLPRRRPKATGDGAAAADTGERGVAMIQCAADGDDLDVSTTTPRGTQADWGAPLRQADGGVVVGLTAEVIKSPGISLDRFGRAVVVDKHMMAFDEVWPADLPALRPLRLDLRRPCRTRVAGAATEAGVGPAGSARCKGSGKGGGRDDRPEGYGGPVFLMPMHREGKGVQGREDKLFAEPPRLRREDDEAAMNRDRFCFRDESRYGVVMAADQGKDRFGGEGERKWGRCKLWETGVDTWRWEWFPEARMMLGKLALWKGALLVSRTQAFVTVFGLGMAGRVVVEGAPHPRGLLIEAYVPASSETCQLYVSVDDLRHLFWDDPQKILVGRKAEMVLELVKMLYFDYCLEFEEADPQGRNGVIVLKPHFYSDREPWECLSGRRDTDFDLHWERRKSTARQGLPPGPTDATPIATRSAHQEESPPRGLKTSSAGNSGSFMCGSSVTSTAGTALDKNPLDGNAPTAAVAPTMGSGSSTTSLATVPDERAVWIHQRLRIRSSQNLVDLDSDHLDLNGTDDVEGSGGGDRAARSPHAAKEGAAARFGARMRGRKKAAGKVRVKTFDIRVEEYKEERRQAEQEKEAKLRAWLAIKKRFRGLTLGTAVRVSGRLLALMVYESPDQPGNLRVNFTEVISGGTFRVSIGIGPVAALARHLSIAATPGNWTLGQRRRVIGSVVRSASALEPASPEEQESASRGRHAGAKTRRRGSGRALKCCVIRCLGRQSTAALIPAAPTAASGFTRRRNAHQLLQPSPKDHRRRFPVYLRPKAAESSSRAFAGPLLSRGAPTAAGSRVDVEVDPAEPRSWGSGGGDGGESVVPNPSHGPFGDRQTAFAGGLVGTTIGDHAEGEAEALGAGDGSGLHPPFARAVVPSDVGMKGAGRAGPEATARAEAGHEPANDVVDAFVPGRPRRRLRPRRECGRGKRLCGGVARVAGTTPGYFSLLRGNWAGAENEFFLDWHHPRGFRAAGFGPVEAHTTFTLELLGQDLHLFTEGSGLMAAAESWGLNSRVDGPAGGGGGVTVPRSGVGVAADPASPAATAAKRKLSSMATAGTARPESSGPESHEGTGGEAPFPSTLPAGRRGQGERGEEWRIEEHGPTVGAGQSPTLVLTESEAWERVAREVLRKCSWRRTSPGPAHDGPAGPEPEEHSLEEFVLSQAYQTAPSEIAPPSTERVPHSERETGSSTVAAAGVQLALGAAIFRRVIKVAGVGIPPMYLLVVVSQWHQSLVVRCYDFLSGVTRDAERPHPERDAALILEFKNMTKVERAVQLQVMLDELVVFNAADAAESRDDPEASWSVRFEEDGAVPIMIDGAGTDTYAAQAEEQMAAAAATVEKRREDTRRVQEAAREKDRRAREKRKKREEKRREAQAKSRKAGGRRKNGAKRLGRKNRGGDASSEDGDDSNGSGEAG